MLPTLRRQRLNQGADGPAPDPARLRDWLKAQVPEYQPGRVQY